MKKDVYCLPFASQYALFPKGSNTPDLVGYGSFNLYNLLKSARVPVNLYYDCDALHGFETACKTCPFLANYGTVYDSIDSMEQYFAERSINFFQHVILDSTNFTTTKFTDCENYQVSCHTKDSNNNCSDTNTCSNSFGFGDGDGGVTWDSLMKNTSKNTFYETGTNNVLLPDDKRRRKRTTARHT
jgi:hypothetical protein